MTEQSFKLRMLIIFPSILFFWYLWVFKYRWKSADKQTINEINRKKFKGRKGLGKIILAYVFGFPLLLGFFAWSTMGIPAWVAFFFADTPYVHDYIYVPGEFIANGYKFRDVATGSSASVRVTPKLYRSFPDEINHLYVHKVVCVRGRTSEFGTIVERIDGGTCLENEAAKMPEVFILIKG